MARGRCDHDPRDPKLRLRVAIAPDLPKFIRDAIDRSWRVYTDQRLFPELTGHSLAGRAARIRRRRSSRMEAIAQTLAALARRCDRRTLRIGDQRDDGLCNGVTIYKLREATGLSRSRVGAALRELETAGYVTTKSQPVVALSTPRRLPNGRLQTHIGFAAQRLLTPLAFQRLGFTAKKIHRARQRGYEDWQRRKAAALSAVAIIATKRALRGLATVQKPAGVVMPTRYYELELRLKADHPDWPLDRLQAEARRLLRR